MAKIACTLVAGDIVSSGEIVMNNMKSVHLGETKALVTLKNLKTGSVRVAAWGYYSRIFMKKNVKPA